MTTSQSTRLRLLPWLGPEGNPALLATDGSATRLSLLADEIEAELLEAAAVVVELARPMVEPGSTTTVTELRFVGRRLIECLTDVLTIAESRGYRLPPYADEARPR